MKPVHSLNRINELMSRFVAQVKGASSMSRTGINKTAETILIPLFKEIYGYSDLNNINYAEDDNNYPGIDLGDEIARVTFQITATRNLAKVQHTLRQFVKHEQYKKYDRVVIYILTEKQGSYSDTEIKQIIQDKFNFDTKKDIWDFQDILKEVCNFQVDKLQKIESILEANFGGERQSPKGNARKLKPSDIECIYQARDILMGNLDNPPSLLALAHQVGLNDYKLKQGFRQVFGTTTFGYLHTQRMERARLLLESSTMNVTQVAQAVGYTNISQFAAAFRKQFGVNPSVFKT